MSPHDRSLEIEQKLKQVAANLEKAPLTESKGTTLIYKSEAGAMITQQTQFRHSPDKTLNSKMERTH